MLRFTYEKQNEVFWGSTNMVTSNDLKCGNMINSAGYSEKGIK